MKFRILSLVLLCTFFALPVQADSIKTKYGWITFEEKGDLEAYGHTLRKGFWNSFNFKMPDNKQIIELHEQLVEEVAKRMDIDPKGMNVTIELIPKDSDLQKSWKKAAGEKAKERAPYGVNAYYSSKHKRIYYTYAKLSRKLLKHEMAHAVLDHHFIKRIPSPVHEWVAEGMEWAD